MFTQGQFSQRFGMLPLVHHMTAVKNLEGIFREGALLPYATMQSRSYENLALDDIQERRASKTTPCGKALHQYVPLYFSYKTPMAAKRQDRNREWVYLTFKMEKVAGAVQGLAVADGNAASDSTTIKMVNSLDDFDVLDPQAIYATSYGGNAELGRKKSSELLVPDRLSLDFLLSITAIDAEVSEGVRSIVEPFGLSFNLRVAPSWFFVTTEPEEGGFFV